MYLYISSDRSNIDSRRLCYHSYDVRLYNLHGNRNPIKLRHQSHFKFSDNLVCGRRLKSHGCFSAQSDCVHYLMFG